MERHRFVVLDVFRGLAATLVFWFHLNFIFPHSVLDNAFIRNSDLFVDFFFILSGFVISYTYPALSTKTDLFRFFGKRFFRLYPLHFCMLLVYVGMEFLRRQLGIGKPNPMDNGRTFLSNLFLFNSVKLPGITDVGWNHPSWSISAEVIAYTLFGILSITIARMGADRFRTRFYPLVAVLALALLRGITGGFNLMYVYDYGFLRGIAGFFLGASCFTVFARTMDRYNTLSASWFTAAEVVSLVALAVLVPLGATLKPYGFEYEGLFAGCVFIWGHEKGALSRWLAGRPLLLRMGKYSYSIYMTHAVLIALFSLVYTHVLKLPPSWNNFLIIPDCIIVYGVSVFTYRQIEQRLVTIGKKYYT